MPPKTRRRLWHTMTYRWPLRPSSVRSCTLVFHGAHARRKHYCTFRKHQQRCGAKPQTSVVVRAGAGLPLLMASVKPSSLHAMRPVVPSGMQVVSQAGTASPSQRTANRSGSDGTMSSSVIIGELDDTSMPCNDPTGNTHVLPARTGQRSPSQNACAVPFVSV